MKTYFKISGVLCLMVLVLLGVTSLWLLIINTDESISADAQAFSDLSEAAQGVKSNNNNNNAYVLAVGFDAPPNEDPQSAGAVALAEYDAWLRSDDAAGGRRNWVPPPTEPRPVSLELKRFSDVCSLPGAPCFSWLERAENISLLASQSALGARYAALVHHQDWHEDVTRRRLGPGLKVGALRSAQAWVLVQAWRDPASTQNAERIREDAVFWRMVLNTSNDVFTKNIAAQHLRRHLAWLNAIVRKQPDSPATAVLETLWQIPLTREALRLPSAWADAWWTTDALMRLLATSKNPFGPGSDVATRPAFRRFLLPQATSNMAATLGMRMLKNLDVPDAELQKGLEANARIVADLRSYDHVLKDDSIFYNPVGKTMYNFELFDPGAFLVPAFRLEPMRRAVLALHAARLKGVTAGQLEAYLRAAPPALQDPFPPQPFGVRAETVVVTSLSSGAKESTPWELDY